MNSGYAAEDLVRRQYEQQGCKLLAQNYIFRRGKQIGELDLIFQKNKEIIFVEVKARRNTKFGNAFEAVDIYKQRKLVKTAKLYLQLHPEYTDLDYRIDVAGVDIDNLAQPAIILVNAIEDVD